MARTNTKRNATLDHTDNAYMIDTPIDNETTHDEPTAAAPYLDLSKADDIIALIPRGTVVIVAIRFCVVRESDNGNLMLNCRSTIERILSTPADVQIDPDIASTWVKRTISHRFMFTLPNAATGSRGTIGQTRKAFEAFGVPWARQVFNTREEFTTWLHSVTPLLLGAVAEAVIGIDSSDPNNPRSYDESGVLYPDKNSIYGFRRLSQPALAARPNTPRPIANDDDLPF